MAEQESVMEITDPEEVVVLATSAKIGSYMDILRTLAEKKGDSKEKGAFNEHVKDLSDFVARIVNEIRELKQTVSLQAGKINKINKNQIISENERLGSTVLIKGLELSPKAKKAGRQESYLETRQQINEWLNTIQIDAGDNPTIVDAVRFKPHPKDKPNAKFPFRNDGVIKLRLGAPREKYAIYKQLMKTGKNTPGVSVQNAFPKALSKEKQQLDLKGIELRKTNPGLRSRTVCKDGKMQLFVKKDGTSNYKRYYMPGEKSKEEKDQQEDAYEDTEEELPNSKKRGRSVLATPKLIAPQPKMVEVFQDAKE